MYEHDLKLDIKFKNKSSMLKFSEEASGFPFVFNKFNLDKSSSWPKKFDPIRIKMLMDREFRYSKDKSMMCFEKFIPIPDIIKSSPFEIEKAKKASNIIKNKVVSGEEWMLKNWGCINMPSTFFYDYEVSNEEIQIYFTVLKGVPKNIMKKISELFPLALIELNWECHCLFTCGTDRWRNGEHVMVWDGDLDIDNEGEVLTHIY